MLRVVISAVVLLGIAALLPNFGEAAEDRSPSTVRFATFNIQELSLKKLNEVDSDGRGTNGQLRNCAEILQRVRPDVVLINEIDAPSTTDDRESINPSQNAAKLFVERYLAVGSAGLQPLDYAHIYIAPSNTGIPTGLDLDNDGKTDGPADSFGFGRYPGEYGMALLSRYPLKLGEVRTFRKLLWKEMPGHLMPDGSDGRPDFYTAAECDVFRLSSKSHWDIPLDVRNRVIHLLCSHPTPPVFDGPEDSNGRRNHDEIRFWADYLSGPDRASGIDRSKWIHDDAGRFGGLAADADFVILGDLNAEPVRGELVNGRRPIDLLLKHPRVFDPQPKSEGAEEQRNDLALKGYLPFKTSDFGRLDYVLPSKSLLTARSGVFWPSSKSQWFHLVDTPKSSSDHRLVWADVELP